MLIWNAESNIGKRDILLNMIVGSCLRKKTTKGNLLRVKRESYDKTKMLGLSTNYFHLAYVDWLAFCYLLLLLGLNHLSYEMNQLHARDKPSKHAVISTINE